MASGAIAIQLQRFLASVYQIYATGSAVPETSYYAPLSQLLEDVGKTLNPKIQPVIHIKNRGSGIPDGGLFVVRPRSPANTDDPLAASAPERGVIEVKPVDRDITKIVASAQVRRYVERYGKVIVTTLKEWAVVDTDPSNGRPRKVDTFSIAATPAEFWAIAKDPQPYCSAHGYSFIHWLELAIDRGAVLAQPAEVARLLASHAKIALARIENKDVHALKQLRGALEESLGLRFEAKQGEHFFKSTLIQTLFYGIFSAWVLWNQATPRDGELFHWKQAAWYLNVPMVNILFEKIAVPSTLRRLGIEEIMEWTDEALARVDRTQFFARFEKDKAVQFFYEPFLEHFDAQLREEFGVWYTPSEVVDYMVDRVDQLLISDFGLAKGVADERVIILDPCVGTGSYLLAALRKIAQRLPEDALAGEELKRAATTRVIGFEVLPAPFVVAHLQVGLLLSRAGAPLVDNERVAIYLTNALTGWPEEQEQRPLVQLPYPELEEEREAAHKIKKDAPIVVILGNPPYYPFAGIHSAEEMELLAHYKEGISTRNSLNDLYVRFFRVAERRIVEGLGHGIISFITNFSYLHEPGFARMRRVLLDEFDRIYIDCLNGDSRETGKRTPDGSSDPSIFVSETNRQGIRVGTAIGTYVRFKGHSGSATVQYRDFWGNSKKQDLIAAASSADTEAGYEKVQLTQVNRLAFRPSRMNMSYDEWPQVIEFAGIEPSLGLNENRGGSLTDSHRESLAIRMKLYLDSSKSSDRLRGTDAAHLVSNWAGYDAGETRKRLLEKGGFDEEKLTRFISRPLDVQWAYLEPAAKLWNRSRAKELISQAQPGNHFLLARRRAPRADDGAPMLPSSCLGDQHALNKDAYYIPIYHYPLIATGETGAEDGLFDEQAYTPVANLSSAARHYLHTIGVSTEDSEYAELLWQHALAITYSRKYAVDNAGGIAADWPRIPVPQAEATLRCSADLGYQLMRLLDPLREPCGTLHSAIGAIRRVDGQPIQIHQGDLEVRARWGIAQQSGVMPSSGRLVTRDYSAEERRALGPLCDELGDPMDVYLNDGTYWSCVPRKVWAFKIGGFQVLKKWLSYREHGSGPPLLGRSLVTSEARCFTNIAQRLAMVAAMERSLDSNYENVLVDLMTWPPVKARP
jgi:hypothetical protein